MQLAEVGRLFAVAQLNFGVVSASVSADDLLQRRFWNFGQALALEFLTHANAYRKLLVHTGRC